MVRFTRENNFAQVHSRMKALPHLGYLLIKPDLLFKREDKWNVYEISGVFRKRYKLHFESRLRRDNGAILAWLCLSCECLEFAGGKK